MFPRVFVFLVLMSVYLMKQPPLPVWFRWGRPSPVGGCQGASWVGCGSCGPREGFGVSLHSALSVEVFISRDRGAPQHPRLVSVVVARSAGTSGPDEGCWAS